MKPKKRAGPLGRCYECGQSYPAHTRDDIGTCERWRPILRWEGVADVTSFAENNVKVTRYFIGNKRVTRAHWIKVADKHGLGVPDWIRTITAAGK